MARDINRRLGSLKARRDGTDRIYAVASTEQLNIYKRSLLEESYQKRVNGKPYTRYAIGSMQEVDENYTRISIETANRVKEQLKNALTSESRSVDFRLQGSVPCNVHIRGVSDVDLLILDDSFYTYDQSGSLAKSGQYRNPVGYTPISALRSLRTRVENILTAKYPAADIDTSGSKAVKVSGGSLPRPVDVVPSHWHDTIDYQVTRQEHDRAVCVLDKKANESIENMPFRHIKLITDRDRASLYGLKKSIRLCKSVKSDSENEGTTINLPSYDIAAIMYHANREAFAAGATYELAILAETQRHLDQLATNRTLAQSLVVPDGTRQIFNTEEKFSSLIHLSLEMDDLLKEVAKEQDYRLNIGDGPSLFTSRSTVSSVFVPFM